MNKILITYDLRKQGANYSDLIGAIKKYPKAVKVCESVWLIKALSSCMQVREKLNRYIDGNDRLFVANLTGEAAWRNVIGGTETIKDILK